MKTFKQFILLTFTLALTLGLSACDSNPVDEEEEITHEEPYGISLEINETEVYRVLNGQVSCAAEVCRIRVSLGATSAPIDVIFLDEDGNEMDAEDFDPEFTLGYEFQDGSIAAFVEEEERWAFRLRGANVGSSPMQIQLLHNEHADFTSPPLTAPEALVVTVN